MLKLGILISGSGSNLQAIIDAVAQGEIKGEIAVVISNRPGVFGLERAARHGLSHLVINHQDFAGREDFERELEKQLRDFGVELVVLAGFMRVLGSRFLAAFPNRVINIHPALLPAFPGTHGQDQAFAYGVKLAGCTVHFVDEKVDHGPIIMQAAVPVLDSDSRESLAARILACEHRIFPRALALYCAGRLRLDGRRVLISDADEVAAASAFLLSVS